MIDLSLTIKKTQEALITRRFSSVELTKVCLERIKKLDTKLNAFVTVAESDALKQAEDADQKIKDGNANSPLNGIPFALKDTYVTTGIKTSASSRVLENYIGQYDATVYSKLRDYGAVLLGKNNQDAWGHGVSTEHSDFGTTRNPWNPDYVSGGSSGGSAAAVSSDMCLFAIGEDTGGSIRQPASFCNIVGLKVTYGRVSRYGAIAFASSLDTVGPMTKTVEDAALILSHIAGIDSQDATTAMHSPQDYLESLRKGIKGVRIGLPKEYFAEGIDPEVKELIMNAAKRYEELGASVYDVSLPSTKYGVAAYYIIAPAETSSNLSRYDGIRYGKGREYFGQEAKRRIMIGTYALSSGYYDTYYLKAQKMRTLIKKEFEGAFSACDVLLAPVVPTPPFKVGEKNSDPLSAYLADIYTIPASIAGIPGLSVPCGFTKNNLPVGMQIIGPQFREDLILQVGYAYEQVTQWHKRKPKLNYE